MPSLYISAAHKSSGKTVLSVGLCAAWRARGLSVAPFKKGPDYIDPMWLTAAAGRDCYNLDFNTMERAERQAMLARGADADLCLIEGTKGLHDGVASDGSDSNAALARELDAPVLLAIDCRGMTRGIAPLLRGYRDFDPALKLRGVVLNRCGGARHESKLRTAVETYTDLPVLGALPDDPGLRLAERHLGLTPVRERDGAAAWIETLGKAVAAGVDLATLHPGAPRPLPAAPAPAPEPTGGVVIGVLRDRAFGFYYPDDLEHLRRAGARLEFIDALTQPRLPPVHGLFIGGGFPETQLRALADNAGLRGELREAIAGGLPVYAECGGLMYLSRSLSWRGECAQMVAALPLDCAMCERPQGRGYVALQCTDALPWPVTPPGELTLRAHEFHYSTVSNADAGLRYAFRVQRGHGIDGSNDGIVHRKVLANYAHLRHTKQSPWADGFVGFVAAQHQRAQDQVEHG